MPLVPEAAGAASNAAEELAAAARCAAQLSEAGDAGSGILAIAYLYRSYVQEAVNLLASCAHGETGEGSSALLAASELAVRADELITACRMLSEGAGLLSQVTNAAALTVGDYAERLRGMN